MLVCADKALLVVWGAGGQLGSLHGWPGPALQLRRVIWGGLLLHAGKGQ